MTGNAAARTANAEDRPHRPGRWVTAVVAGIFGLFYAYDVWEAIGNLVGLGSAAAALGTSFSAFGWTVLIVAILMPIVVFGLAVWLGRGRRVPVQALLLAAGLCLSAVLSLDIYVVFGLGNLIV